MLQQGAVEQFFLVGPVMVSKCGMTDRAIRIQPRWVCGIDYLLVVQQPVYQSFLFLAMPQSPHVT